MFITIGAYLFEYNLKTASYYKIWDTIPTRNFAQNSIKLAPNGKLYIGYQSLDTNAAFIGVRGVTLTEIACEEFGSGEWQRVFAGSAPGRAPFRLELGQRTAPTANANSYYGATIDLSGRVPAPSAARQTCTNPNNLIL